MKQIELINKLKEDRILTESEFAFLIETRNEVIADYLFSRAIELQKEYYGNSVYIRGLIEISSYCRNNCYYCGIRASNTNAKRYRINKDQILQCCDYGYKAGFRTFVLQGGEDVSFNTDVVVDLVSTIRQKYPDCAITLSLGEYSYDDYKKMFKAGANRYLLRHETADSNHYSRLHPTSMSLKKRMECIYALKEIGFQTGTGFMVGSPYQTPQTLAKDLLFIRKLEPGMVGIGPFIPHHETPFAKEKGGTLELTLFMIGLLRVMLPNLLLPATTALGSIVDGGRERGILSGANVIMPNLSPVDVREKYMIYDNKLISGVEAAENLEELKRSMKKIGYEIVIDRGDVKELKD